MCVDRLIHSPRASAGIQVFRGLVDLESTRNVALSPVGLENALAVLYEGARGSTRVALGKVLGVTEGCELRRKVIPQDEGIVFQSATSLWAPPASHSRRVF